MPSNQIPVSPLTPEHHDMIVSLLRSKEHVPASLALAASNGVQTKEIQEAYDYAKNGLSKVLADYFPKGRNSKPGD